ncbi:MAG: RNA-directed DNA polymerase [Lachnospiraceae bacterium]|nr:RNA-directed DNA polymerase [Lachnospiraceae bacterium]
MDFQQHLKRFNLPIRNLIDEISDDRNISESFDYVVNHLECPEQREHIRPKKKPYCKALKRLLSSGEFRITPEDFRTIEVTDGPKRRIVQAPTVFHRDGCHSVMVPVERVTYPTLITNTAASIKGRGMHWLHNIIEEDLLADPEGMRYYYQCDIRHYYDSISQEIMKSQIREYITDETVLTMLDNFITLLPEGLSKGLRASQCLANLHLNEVDHSMCEVCEYHDIPNNLHPQGVERRFHYYRYCDDIVFFASEKKTLWKLRDYLCSLLSTLGLEIKPNEAVRPITEGLDYLGYVTFADDSGAERVVYSRIRKRTKQKFARRIKRVKSRKRRQSLIGSFFGMAAHADCRHLLKTLITNNEYKHLKHKRKMKDFGSFKVSPMTLNGKKNFRGKQISARELNNRGVIVVDYEKLIPRWEQDEYNRRCQDASAKNVDLALVPPPKTKYLIQVICDGNLYKIWTGDKEIWHMLDEIEAQQGRPFFAGLVMDYSGKHAKFTFVSPSTLNLAPPTDEQIAELFERYNLNLNPYDND